MLSMNQKNIEEAKLAAQRIYKKVNFDGGNLQSYELSSLMQETYDFLKLQFKPTSNDLKEFLKVLDANGDGAVSLSDLQTLAVQYLCGDGVISGLNTSNVSGAFNNSSYSSLSYQNKANNDYLNYASNLSSKQPVNIGQEFSYNFSSYQQSSKYTNQHSNKGNYLGTADTNTQFQGQSTHSISSQGANLYGSNYGAKDIGQTQQHIQSKKYNVPAQISQEPKSRYTPEAQSYLTITRGLFRKYANQSNTITRDKVSQLLNQTYGALGRQGYYPSEQDVNVWMKLCDTNGDGHVQQAQYEYFVVRALQRSGVKVNA